MCAPQPQGLAAFCGAIEQSCAGIMRMYFHTGMDDVVLFKDFVPCTPVRYAATCVCVIALGESCRVYLFFFPKCVPFGPIRIPCSSTRILYGPAYGMYPVSFSIRWSCTPFDPAYPASLRISCEGLGP